jgi:ubiquinone/menaquinone biosynthesis C-methylase UbiE
MPAGPPVPVRPVDSYLGPVQNYFRQELYRTVACCLDDHSLEELPFADAYFDLAVMINVLDRVKDARACMENLIRVLKPGGFIVIGQDLTGEVDSREHAEGLKTSHPITLDEDWFKPYLDGKFESVLHRVFPREIGRAPQWHHRTLIFSDRNRG